MHDETSLFLKRNRIPQKIFSVLLLLSFGFCGISSDPGGGGCLPSQFTCTNSTSSNVTCVDFSTRCDGVADCSDGSDELWCHGKTQNCNFEMNFNCLYYLLIILAFNTDSCRLARNTISCGYMNSSDLIYASFPLSPFKCISLSLLCDGNNDCPDGVDELGCSTDQCSDHSSVVIAKCSGADRCQKAPSRATAGLTSFSFTCSCPGNFTTGRSYSDLNSLDCQDYDECALSSNTCSQICSNSIGGFTCSCRTGFSPSASDNKRCEPTCKNLLIFPY